MFGDHSEHIKYADFAFIQGADGLKILKPKEDNAKYVYYAFVNFYKKQASYKRHWSKAKKTPIPLPPLAVQEEIVRILDKFTALEAELEAELEARKKQYAHYREKLLTFTGHTEWKTLGEVCTFKRGKSLQKSDIGKGDVPIVLYGELYTTYGNYIKHIQSHTSADIAEKAALAYKSDLLLPLSSTTKEAQIGKASALSTDTPVYVGGDTLILSHSQIPGYLVHLLNCSWFESLKMKCTRGTTIMHLSPKELAKIPIPLPPLSEQERIVRILDKFDALVCGISEGLPREIALRRKQYEHYCGQLLGFQ